MQIGKGVLLLALALAVSAADVEHQNDPAVALFCA